MRLDSGFFCSVNLRLFRSVVKAVNSGKSDSILSGLRSEFYGNNNLTAIIRFYDSTVYNLFFTFAKFRVTFSVRRSSPLPPPVEIALTRMFSKL